MGKVPQMDPLIRVTARAHMSLGHDEQVTSLSCSVSLLWMVMSASQGGGPGWGGTPQGNYVCKWLGQSLAPRRAEQIKVEQLKNLNKAANPWYPSKTSMVSAMG